MGRKNSKTENKEIERLMARYEEAKAQGQQLYLDPDQLADIINQYAYQSLFEKAQEAVTYGLYLHPRSTRLLIEQAYLYLDGREIDLAEQVIESICEEYDPEVKLLKAELLLNKGDIEGAYELLITVGTTEGLDVFIDAVYLFLDSGYPGIAKEWLDKGEAKYGQEKEFITAKANYLTMTNQMEKAAAYYNRLIDDEPYNPCYWVALAKCRFSEDEYEKTIEACDFALAADEEYGEAYLYRAHSLFYVGNSEAAVADYKKAIAHKVISPATGYMFIGTVYMGDENWEKSNLYFEKVIHTLEEKQENDPSLLAEAYINKAKVAFNLGNNEEAHHLCEQAKSIDPEEKSIYLTEGKVYLDEDMPEKAAEAFQQALKYDADIETRYIIGSIYTNLDILEEAKVYYNEIFEEDPHYADVAEKLTAISLVHNEIDNFFKYNEASPNPLNEATITEMLNLPNHTEESRKMLHEIIRRMRNKEE